MVRCVWERVSRGRGVRRGGVYSCVSGRVHLGVHGTVCNGGVICVGGEMRSVVGCMGVVGVGVGCLRVLVLFCIYENLWEGTLMNGQFKCRHG